MNSIYYLFESYQGSLEEKNSLIEEYIYFEHMLKYQNSFLDVMQSSM